MAFIVRQNADAVDRTANVICSGSSGVFDPSLCCVIDRGKSVAVCEGHHPVSDPDFEIEICASYLASVTSISICRGDAVYGASLGFGPGLVTLISTCAYVLQPFHRPPHTVFFVLGFDSSPYVCSHPLILIP